MSQDFVDFEDVEVKPRFKEKYKGVPAETHRISIIWPKEVAEGAGTGPFVMRNTHYHEKYFVCKEGICCEKLSPSKQRFSCLVVKYKTNKDGTLKKYENTPMPFDFSVMEWVFTDNKFGSLKTLHDEWNLKEHDIMVKLKGTEKFQDLEFTPAKECVWKMKPEFMDAVYKESEEVRPNLVSTLGADLTTDEIKELLGLGVATPNDVIANEEDLNEILAEV